MAPETVRPAKPHLTIFVKNLGASVAFYRKLFGVAPARLRRGYARFDVSNPPLKFILDQSPEVPRGALSHLGIQVTSADEVVATRERWLRNGLPPRDEVQTHGCYALQDKAWVRDPDGNEWEAFALLADEHPEKAVPEGGSPERACCSPAHPAAR